jgi:hypothetical protein
VALLFKASLTIERQIDLEERNVIGVFTMDLTLPFFHSLLPLPAAMIKHCMKFPPSSSIDKGLGHPIGFIISVLFGQMFQEIGSGPVKYAALTPTIRNG